MKFLHNFKPLDLFHSCKLGRKKIITGTRVRRFGLATSTSRKQHVTVGFFKVKYKYVLQLYASHDCTIFISVKFIGEKMSTDVQVTDGRSIYVLLILVSPSNSGPGAVEWIGHFGPPAMAVHLGYSVPVRNIDGLWSLVSGCQLTRCAEAQQAGPFCGPLLLVLCKTTLTTSPLHPSLLQAAATHKYFFYRQNLLNDTKNLCNLLVDIVKTYNLFLL